MSERKISRLYYLETFLLLGFFIAVTMILTRSFVFSREISMKATKLTDAVILAENAAEAFKGSKDPQEMAEHLNEKDNVILKENGNSYLLTAGYDAERNPDGGGYYRVDCEISYQSNLGDATINVYNEGDLIYTLQLASYNAEVGHE